MVYSLLLTPIILSMGIIGGSYGFYKLGMWSVRKRLEETREQLIKIDHREDDKLLSNITNHIREIDMFNNGEKNIYSNINADDSKND